MCIAGGFLKCSCPVLLFCTVNFHLTPIQLSAGRLSVHLDTEEGMEKGLLQDVDMSNSADSADSADCLGTGWLKAVVTQPLAHQPQITTVNPCTSMCSLASTQLASTYSYIIWCQYFDPSPWINSLVFIVVHLGFETKVGRRTWCCALNCKRRLFFRGKGLPW